MWVIPFDNHAGSETDLVSVGLNFNGHRVPKPGGRSGEEV